MRTETSIAPSPAVVVEPSATGARAVHAVARAHRQYRIAVAVILGAFALMLVWNVAQYPSGRSQDAQQQFAYVETLRHHERLPTDGESAVAHDPPVFYLVAAGIESTWTAVTGAPGGQKVTHKTVQLVNVLLALGIALLVLMIARELFPKSRMAQLAGLAFFALSPPVARTAVMYHGETLATLLATSALYVVIRGLVRDELTVKAGAIAGILLGLGVLTRQFVVATAAAVGLALALYFVFTRRRRVLAFGGTLILSVALLASPWFIYRTIRTGRPFSIVCSTPATAGCPLARRLPAPGPSETVFTAPYRPRLGNQAAQIFYADWWGDYFLYYDVPEHVRVEATASGRLPSSYHDERVRQSYVGLLPTLLMLAGLLGLTLEGVRRRRAAVLAVPLTAAMVGIAELAYYVLYPVADNDTLKVVYVLSAVPTLAVGAGWAVWRLRERSRAVFSIALAVLLAAAVLDAQFLWL